MKKSHIVVYIISFVLMAASYAYYAFCYKGLPLTLYMHSYHFAGFGYLLVPILFELIFKKDLPLEVLIGYIVFIFASQILGSAYDGYSKFPLLDSVVHAFSAVVVVLFISSLSKEMLGRNRVLENLVYLVGFGMIVGVVWEIVEFCGDSWFGMNNQIYRSGNNLFVGQAALKDTMIDFICDFIGAVAASVFVLIKLKIDKNRSAGI